jgi:hypothetical protein
VGAVRINADVAMFKSLERIRNRRGECLAACSELLHVVSTPELATPISTRRALAFASEDGFGQIILALDCLCMLLFRTSLVKCLCVATG